MTVLLNSRREQFREDARDGVTRIPDGEDSTARRLHLLHIPENTFVRKNASRSRAIGESKRFFERWRTLPDRSIATSIAGAERSVAAFATV